jgi:hypothetical protein
MTTPIASTFLSALNCRNPLDPQVGVPLRADFPNMHELTLDFERFIRDLEDFNRG